MTSDPAHWEPEGLNAADKEFFHEKVALLVADGMDELDAELTALWQWYDRQSDAIIWTTRVQMAPSPFELERNDNKQKVFGKYHKAVLKNIRRHKLPLFVPSKYKNSQNIEDPR